MATPDGFLSEDAKYIISFLLPELARSFEQWSKEYQAPRELGERAEFVEMHRKLGKLKLAFWDDVDTSDWREQPRQILMELAAHAFLAVCSLDSAETDGDGEAVRLPSFSVQASPEQRRHEAVIFNAITRALAECSLFMKLSDRRKMAEMIFSKAEPLKDHPVVKDDPNEEF